MIRALDFGRIVARAAAPAISPSGSGRRRAKSLHANAACPPQCVPVRDFFSFVLFSFVLWQPLLFARTIVYHVAEGDFFWCFLWNSRRQHGEGGARFSVHRSIRVVAFGEKCFVFSSFNNAFPSRASLYDRFIDRCAKFKLKTKTIPVAMGRAELRGRRSSRQGSDSMVFA